MQISNCYKLILISVFRNSWVLFSSRKLIIVCNLVFCVLIDGFILPMDIFFVSEGFADEMGKARKVGALKQYVVGRSSEATFADAFEKQEAILRYLGNIDPSGEVCF